MARRGKGKAGQVKGLDGCLDGRRRGSTPLPDTHGMARLGVAWRGQAMSGAARQGFQGFTRFSAGLRRGQAARGEVWRGFQRCGTAELGESCQGWAGQGFIALMVVDRFDSGQSTQGETGQGVARHGLAQQNRDGRPDWMQEGSIPFPDTQGNPCLG